MITALIACSGLMLAMYLMRTSASRVRRDPRDGIRWRGIDWSRADDADAPQKAEDDQFKNGQD